MTFEVCSCCLLTAANGSPPDDCTNPTPLCLVGGVAIAEGSDLGFKKSGCDGCGDPNWGERFALHVMEAATVT